MALDNKKYMTEQAKALIEKNEVEKAERIAFVKRVAESLLPAAYSSDRHELAFDPQSNSVIQSSSDPHKWAILRAELFYDELKTWESK